MVSHEAIIDSECTLMPEDLYAVDPLALTASASARTGPNIKDPPGFSSRCSHQNEAEASFGVIDLPMKLGMYLNFLIPPEIAALIQKKTSLGTIRRFSVQLKFTAFSLQAQSSYLSCDAGQRLFP